MLFVATLLATAQSMFAANPRLADATLAEWVVHDRSHFQIRAPEGWIVTSDVSTTSGVVDLILRGAPDDGTGPQGGFLAVTAEVRGALGSARSILQEGLDSLTTYSGFRVVEPARDGTVDGHPAASAVVTYSPSTYGVYETLTVVVGAEWARFWALAGIVFTWDIETLSPTVNESMATFHVLPGPPGSAFLVMRDWILFGGLLATACAGAVLGILILRGRKDRTT